MIVEHDVVLYLRDGTPTLATIYRPHGQRVPVLLARTSYSRDLPLSLGTVFAHVHPEEVVRRGFAVVLQEGRSVRSAGRFFTPFRDEIEDGFDAVEWCAARPWSTGRVGMLGSSYLGAAAWLAALSRAPALHAIAPRITGADGYSWAYQGGAFQLGFALPWALRMARARLGDAADSALLAARDRILRANEHLSEPLGHLPLASWDGLRSAAPPVPYYDWLDHPTADEYWSATNIYPHYASLGTAVLNVGGWFDVFARGTIQNHAGVSAESRVPESSTLIMGPWGHDNPFRSHLGELNFGELADPQHVDLDGLTLRFFDRWLRDGDAYPKAGEPRVRLFVMGINRWRADDDWPLSSAVWTPLYLTSEGSANTSAGSGRLEETPDSVERLDGFSFDPMDPVPTWGGPSRVHGVSPKGPLDQRRLELRNDVLVYTSAILGAPLEVTGLVRVQLWVLSSAPDTDFTAKLVDVWPTGHAFSVTDGILRARYGLGPAPAHQRLLPDVPAELTIELGPTSIVFGKGHRIRLEISSSNFPRFDRNTNTGGCIATDRHWQVARQQVLHGGRYASALLIPIVRS